MLKLLITGAVDDCESDSLSLFYLSSKMAATGSCSLRSFLYSKECTKKVLENTTENALLSKVMKISSLG